MYLEISSVPIATTTAFYFIFSDNKILVRLENDQIFFPTSADLQQFDFPLVRQLFLGTIDQNNAYSAEITEAYPLPDQWQLSDLRSLMPLIADHWFWIAGKAFQLMYWYRTHQFCGSCGQTTKLKATEKAMVCSACDLSFYPRISPAIIVAVIKEDQILLAHALRFPQKFYSTLAGFVEAGESLEECLHREVREEVGIEVKNVRYFGSQPWAFPHSLMVGFTAEYESGEIQVDTTEIDHADWFTADHLPVRPNRFSIASQLINWFVKEQQQKK